MKWIKLQEDAVIPTPETAYSAGHDLVSIEDIYIPPNGSRLISTGIAWERDPEDSPYVGLIWPRSGLSVREHIDVGAGVVDSDYVGEIKVLLRNTNNLRTVTLKAGSRIAQMVIQPCVTFGAKKASRNGGFGSTGE